MTIYRIYLENGNRAGFWVQHRNWSNTCARVISIAGRDAGPLPGAAPRHEEAAVVMLMFDIRSGRALQGEPMPADGAGAVSASPTRTPDAAAEAVELLSHAKPDVLRLDPSDRRYVSIAEPFWHADRRRRGVEQRDDDPRIATSPRGSK